MRDSTSLILLLEYYYAQFNGYFKCYRYSINNIRNYSVHLGVKILIGLREKQVEVRH